MIREKWIEEVPVKQNETELRDVENSRVYIVKNKKACSEENTNGVVIKVGVNQRPLYSHLHRS